MKKDLKRNALALVHFEINIHFVFACAKIKKCSKKKRRTGRRKTCVSVSTLARTA